MRHERPPRDLASHQGSVPTEGLTSPATTGNPVAVRLQWRDRAGLTPASSACTLCTDRTGSRFDASTERDVTRLALIAHAATPATRTASFAGDESIESAPPPVVRRHAL